MLTEQTYLFNIFILFFAIIGVGCKMKMDTKNREIKKSSTNILVINNGETKDFPLKVASYLEKHATIELKDIKVKDSRVEELKIQIKNYHKTILICRMGDRMLLYQEQLIKDLEQQFQNTLQVFYLLNQGSLPYCVPECSAQQQVNIYMSEVDDQRFVEENLKSLIDVTSAEKWMNIMKFSLFLLGLLWIRSMYGYLKSDSAEKFENLQASFLKSSQDYTDLLQENKRLTEEKLQIIELLKGGEHQIKQLNEEKILLDERLISAQDEIENFKHELQNAKHENKELEINVKALSEKIKALESENRELRQFIAENDRVLEQSKNKFISQKNDFEQSISDIQNQREKMSKFLKENVRDYSQKL